jgi:uncharacterized heparinase superfamily protein
MDPRTLPRLFRTVRHLRASQLLWRCRALAERRWRASRARQPAAAIFDRWLAADAFPDVPDFHRIAPAGDELVRDLARGHFTHLNRTVDLGRDEPDWHLGDVSSHRLWTITLHYHGWAHALAEVAAGSSALADEAASLLLHYLSDWIRRCDVRAPGARALAWNSFAIATRLTWWIRSWTKLRARRREPWSAFESRLLASAWGQAAYLHDHLEWDLRGNHLLRDLVGLAWAGRFFGGHEAERWTATASALVPAQIAEQVMSDGAHFERSPTYHLHVMEDLLSLAILLEDAEVVEALKDAWSRMADCLVWLRHPDGRVPLLNDGGMHALCTPDRMLSLGGRLACSHEPSLPEGGKLFSDAGLVVWHGDPWSIFFDVGEIGADHVPGHGHADTLTLECSHGGHRLFVDPGTFGYDDDERRRADRATASHNTVCVDGADSSEVWHIFRVGRRARPTDVRATFGKGGFEAEAAHTGYAHLAGRPVHRRRVTLSAEGALVVTDTLEGRGEHRALGGWLLDPAWSAQADESGWLLSRGGRRLRVRIRARDAEPALDLIEAPYHPDYGVEVATRRLTWFCEGTFPIEVRTEIAEA